MRLLLQHGIRLVHVRLSNVPCVTKSSKGTRRLKAHIKVMHEKTEVHKCVTCNNVFSSQSNLKENNSAIHLGIRKFNCDNCMTKCTRQKGLNNHVRQHHSLEKKVAQNVVRHLGINHRWNDMLKAVDQVKNTPVHHVTRSSQPQEAHSDLHLCEVCWKAFDRKFSATRQFPRVHKDDRNIFRCQLNQWVQVTFEFDPICIHESVTHESVNRFRCFRLYG